MQLQDMRNVYQNCILASGLCFEPPPVQAKFGGTPLQDLTVAPAAVDLAVRRGVTTTVDLT